MKARCNTIVDCPKDESDETNCEKVLFTETYNSQAAPNTGKTVNGEYTVNKVSRLVLDKNHIQHELQMMILI